MFSICMESKDNYNVNMHDKWSHFSVHPRKVVIGLTMTQENIGEDCDGKSTFLLCYLVFFYNKLRKFVRNVVTFCSNL